MSTLNATYTSPSSTLAETFTHPLPALSTPLTTSDRTAYLSTLQTSIKTLQNDINTFLTQKMDEDKLASAAAGKVDDVKEEENYGEEVVGE